MDREDEFLISFFTHITQLCFEKAKECLLKEKERESSRTTQMGPWGMLLINFPQIIVTEKSYADLGFLHTKNKGFLRKDNSLKTMYESLKSDLKRLEEMTKGTSAIGTRVAEISNQICQFITARIQMIEFYEKMYNMSISSKIMRHHDLLLSIESIIESHLLSCPHFAINIIKASLTVESEVLMQLIKAYIEIQNWKFLPSLMALYGANSRLLGWERTLQNRETWKLGSFGATFLKTNQLPALYHWLIKLRNIILAKFTLYFHTILSQQTNSGEMRSIMSKQATDYNYKFHQFQKKCDLSIMAIIFDSRDLQDSGPGYKHPKRDIENPDDFSVVINIPQNFNLKPSFHWENIKKYILQRYSDLLSMDKVIFTKNSHDLWTYAMVNIDPRMTLVTMYENYNKQKDKESHIAAFMSDISLQLRCNKIFESLKLAK